MIELSTDREDRTCTVMSGVSRLRPAVRAIAPSGLDYADSKRRPPRLRIGQGPNQLVADPRPACRAFTIAHTFSTSAPISVAKAAASAPNEPLAEAHTSSAARAPDP